MKKLLPALILGAFALVQVPVYAQAAKPAAAAAPAASAASAAKTDAKKAGSDGREAGAEEGKEGRLLSTPAVAAKRAALEAALFLAARMGGPRP